MEREACRSRVRTILLLKRQVAELQKAAVFAGRVRGIRQVVEQERHLQGLLGDSIGKQSLRGSYHAAQLRARFDFSGYAHLLNETSQDRLAELQVKLDDGQKKCLAHLRYAEQCRQLIMKHRKMDRRQARKLDLRRECGQSEDSKGGLDGVRRSSS